MPAETPAVRGAPLGYIENNLVPGEQVIYKTGYHWIVILWSIVLSFVFAAAGVAALYQAFSTAENANYKQAFEIGGSAALILAAIILMQGIIRRSSTEVAVSNKRVLIKTGILARKSIEVLLSKVESIGVEESAMGRMLGYGSVIVRGTGGTFETFHNISHPDEFRRQVQGQIGSAA
jgi:uncharacterized membrane protein YdbT with pleckstrin-like domain